MEINVTPNNLYRFTNWNLHNPHRSSVLFHIETTYLICVVNETTGFYMKHNTRLKRVQANDSDQYQFSLNENHQATIADLLKIK